MKFDSLLYDVKDGIATITLNKPEIGNAMGPTMLFEVVEAFNETDRDDNVRVVVVTGAGKLFCAGADFSKGAAVFDKQETQKSFKAEGSPIREDGTFDYSHPAARDGGGILAMRIFSSLKPVIGAINGSAAGVGASMTLPMDIRVASDKAKIGFVYARRGIVFECCSSYFLPRVVGMGKAMEWSMTGRLLSAEEAKEGGLYNYVLPTEEVLPKAYAIAKEIVENTSPVSIALMRQMIWRGEAATHPMQAHQIESRGICVRGRSPDAKEGVASFLEKRLPNFESKVSTDMPDYFPWWEEPKYS